MTVQSSPILVEAQRIVESAADDGLFRFPELTDAEYGLVGYYIQHYCYIELNLRRAIDVFNRAGLLAAKTHEQYMMLKTQDLVKEVKRVLPSLLSNEVELEGANRRLLDIEMKLDHRHQLAHWALRKVPNIDAIVMFTNDPREWRRRLGGEVVAEFGCLRGS